MRGGHKEWELQFFERIYRPLLLRNNEYSDLDPPYWAKTFPV